MDNEINNLKGILTTYEDHLNKISSRFNNQDYPESQQAYQDPADQIPGIKAISKNIGKKTINGVVHYLVLSINGATNTITFENSAPPIKIGDPITLSNGNNNGVKTVKNITNFMTIQTVESLTTEEKSNTFVVL